MQQILPPFLLAVAFFECGALQAQTTAVQSGNWNDAATWGGAVPTGIEEDIVIPSGIAVTLNADVECGELLVQGRFEIERADRTLTCDSLIVQGANAEFEVGTNGNRFTDRFVLTLKGDTDENFTHGGHNMGARALLALMGGTISIHGEDRVEWTHLGANVAAGANALTMSEPVDWRAGDEILICSSRTNWNEAEKMTIASVSGDGLTVTLTSNLAYPHAGVTKDYTRPTPSKQWTADLRAEVGLLSRNITIQGAADSVASGHANEGFGAHVMIHGPMTMGATTHPSGEGYVKGVEIFRAGQKSLLGRYPFHWHLCQDAGAGQYFNDSAVHLSFNRAITIHGTDYTTVQNNFCYDHLGHGLFLEDGAERFNVIRDNVVLLTKRPLAGEEVIPSDNSLNEPQNRTPASFWITNPENTFEDNVAAGTHGTGYWFIMPTSALSPSKNLPYYSSLRPHTRPLISFHGNKAHSCMSGFDIFDQLSSNHAIIRNRGWSNSTLHVMDQCTWYANNIGVYAGIGGPSLNQQENIIYRDNVFVDNKSALMLATYNVVEESVFVANSGEGLISGTRSLYLAYDGAGRVRNSHFVGWDAPNANFLSNIGGATKHPNHRFRGITTDHAGTVRIALPDYTAVPPPNIAATDNLHPRRWSVVLRDEDGSLSGQAGASIVGNHPFQIVGDEYQPPNWPRAYRSDHEFALAVEDPGGRPNVTVVRTKPGTPDASVYYVNGYQEHHQLPFIVNGGFTYTYFYEALPSNRRTTFRLDDATAGDNVLVRFKDFGKFGGLSVSGHSAIARGSLAVLKATNRSAYYIEPNGDLYIRPVATGKSQTLTITWSSSVAWSGFDTDGDSLTDGEEAALGRNPFGFGDFGAQFENNGNFEKWDQLNSITGGQVSGGALKGTSTGDSKIINADFNFAASGIESILIRLKASVDSPVLLFWGREDASGFSSTRKETVSYTGGGDWQTLLFPVGSNSEWRDTINAIRIDPMATTGDFEIDWIGASDGDADDDGIPDLTEGFGDVDGDGIANLFDTESDGDWTSDADELAAGRDPYDAGDLAMHFNENGNLEGWTGGANIDSKIVSGGLLSGIAASANPQIVHTGFRFDANRITSIMVRFKVSSAGNVRFFFGTNTADSFSSSRRWILDTPPADEWATVRFPVSTNDEWTGFITRMRMFPINMSGTSMEIDWIRGSDGDFDKDGISDADEGDADLDGDGLANYEDDDSDGDGATDAFELSQGTDPYDTSFLTEIAVEQPAGTDLTDGSSTIAFGNINPGANAQRVFTIRNSGTVNLTGLAASFSGANADLFSAGSLGSATLAPGANTTLNVTYAPTALGNHTATLQIASNDSDENPFDVALSGTGVIATTIDSWAQSHGLSGDDASPTADGDADGISLIEEYAYNLDPNQFDQQFLTPGSGASGLPVIRLVNDRLQIEFLRRKTDVNLTYGPEFAGDLPDGFAAATETEVVTSVDANFDRVIVNDSESVATAFRRFGRLLLQISNPAD